MGSEANSGEWEFTYREIFEYIKNGKYSEGLAKAYKLSLRKRAKFFHVVESSLYYVGGKYSHFSCTYTIAHVGKASSATPRLVVEEPEQRKRIISINHDKKHLGVNRTNEMVAQKYYWPGVYKDNTSYVRSQSSTNMQTRANDYDSAK